MCCVCTHSQDCAQIQTDRQTYTHILTHIQIHTHIHHRHTHICTHTYHTCMYTHIYAHTSTYMRGQSWVLILAHLYSLENSTGLEGRFYALGSVGLIQLWYKQAHTEPAFMFIYNIDRHQYFFPPEAAWLVKNAYLCTLVHWLVSQSKNGSLFIPC